MTNDSLNVWYEKKLVGKIWQDLTGLMGFVYENSWVEEGFAISQQLPLATHQYSPAAGKAHQFFVNLLPEADARLHIVRDLKISNSDFELLKAIGGECAGALSILPEDFKPQERSHYKKLTNEDLKKIILRKGQIFSLTSSKNRPRLSLAGAHDKCPIFFDGENLALPEESSPSTHILKFALTSYRNVPAYEYYLTSLAKSIGLPVAEVQLCKNEKDYYLLIKRYDRILENKKNVQRLHQEDFCQALGISYLKKYQQEGGPSFQDCYHLTEQVTINPIKDTENLLRWQIFNVLAGNSDAHAKNLSLIYNEDHQPELAPFYDLVCTRAIERIDSKLALSVGGEFNPDKISLVHWEKMANECNIRFQFFKKLIQEMAEVLPGQANEMVDEFESSFGPYPALQRIIYVVNKQCGRVLKQL
ncbi:MAG: type II toxin-antitoxin system HipA family toxin [Candidatus Berkiellales bacterium]